MAARLLRVCLLLAASPAVWTCLLSATSCEECVSSGPLCAWCTAPSSRLRCHTAAALQASGCPPTAVYQPESILEVLRDEPGSDPEEARALLLRPQEVRVTLRPGGSQSFTLGPTTPTDRPLPPLTVDSSPLPAGVNISITQGDAPLIEVSVEAGRCDSNQTGWTFHVGPRGFTQRLKLVVTLQCGCECSSRREEASPRCSGRGALECGHCRCLAPYVGPRCNLDAATASSDHLDEACRPRPGGPLCSGRGACVYGACECGASDDPQEVYSGRYCECSNAACPRSQNRMCGGHGRCECGRCVCDAGWSGEACDCSTDAAPCTGADQQVCGGRGACVCGRCRCEPPYAGATCEVCPTCASPCVQHVRCAECHAFGGGVAASRCDQECGSLAVAMVPSKEDLSSGGLDYYCKMRNHDDIYFYYTISQTPSGARATVAAARNVPAGQRT